MCSRVELCKSIFVCVVIPLSLTSILLTLFGKKTKSSGDGLGNNNTHTHSITKPSTHVKFPIDSFLCSTENTISIGAVVVLISTCIVMSQGKNEGNVLFFSSCPLLTGYYIFFYIYNYSHFGGQDLIYIHFHHPTFYYHTLHLNKPSYSFTQQARVHSSNLLVLSSLSFSLSFFLSVCVV